MLQQHPAPVEEMEIEATLLSIIFKTQHSAYIVGMFESNELGESFTATGEIISPSSGDSYALIGSWVTHPKYGKQFKFTSFSIIYPATREGIEKYLGSGLIKGIGKRYAKRVVKMFGERTIDILNNDIAQLLNVEGIGPKKLEKIKESWDEQRGVHTVMLFLKGHQISTGYAVRIYRAYGQNAINVIKENPYRLIDDVDGIGFTIADQIAINVGFAVHDERRLAAGLHYVLTEASRSHGHMFVPRNEVIESARGKLGVDEHEMLHALAHAKEQFIVIEEEENVFLPELYYAEMKISESFARLYGESRPEIDPKSLYHAIKEIEREKNIEFTSLQVEAIEHSIREPVTIITGGPGTGKSTAVLGILALAASLEWKVAMCAPTGRAAKRLFEVTGYEAKTIHRLLEFDPFARYFRKNEDDQIEADLIIVDEVSMVDSLLMAHLLKAVATHSRIVFVGDSDQLPSVGPGNVLHDMIASGCIPSITLKTIFRQAQESAIITNSHRALEGNAPIFRKDCFFVDAETTEEIPQLLEDIVARRLPQEMGFHPMDDIQVLSPMHKTDAGVRNVNVLLQNILNPRGNVFLRKGDRAYRVGDKVMQTKNNYEKDVFNGDIGFITSADMEESTCKIIFDQRTVEYGFDELDDVTLAYCVTIHKSQGSEYKVVIIPVTMQHRIMLQRNLIYTAMTRAKKFLVFVGQRSALMYAIKNDRIARRYSSLKDRMVQTLR